MRRSKYLNLGLEDVFYISKLSICHHAFELSYSLVQDHVGHKIIILIRDWGTTYMGLWASTP